MAPFPEVADAAQYGWLLSPVVALTFNVIVQVMAFRRSRGGHFFRSVIAGFLGGAGALVLLEAAHAFLAKSWEPADALLLDVPIYAALSYCYYNFVQLGQTSIRIRLYMEIAERAGGLAAVEIARTYNERTLMHARLQRLLESGDIVERGGRFLIGKQRLVLVAFVLFLAKKILLGRESEFPVRPIAAKSANALSGSGEQRA